MNATIGKSSRLQIEVSPPQLAHIQALMSVCDFRTQKELINNALTLFEWAVEEVQRGNDVAAFNRDNNSYEVLRMPALKTAARHSLERGGGTGSQEVTRNENIVVLDPTTNAVGVGNKPVNVA